MERRWRLRDCLAIPARELFPNRLDHLPLARHDLERLGNILAQLAQPIGAAAGACLGCSDDDALARQVLGQGLAGGPLALERRDIRPGSGQRLILAGSGFPLLEGQLHLVEQMARTFGSLAIKGAAHLLVLKFEKGIASFQIGVDRLDPGYLGGDRQGCGKLLAKALDLCLRLISHAQSIAEKYRNL